MGATLDTSDDVNRRSRKGRANYPAEFKAQVVAQASAPGVSVAKVAQRHQLNTNMVFRWMREAQRPASSPTRLQLVEVVEAPVCAPAEASVPASIAVVSSTPAPVPAIEVVFPAALVRVHGEVSQSLLRSVFSALAKAL